jgi:putative FmdB family regulatory protein
LPIREYVCGKCGNRFENIEIDVTTGRVVCPNCGSKTVEQVFSIFSSSRTGKSSCNIARPST